MAAPLQRQTHLRVQVPGGKHSPLDCYRQRQARTLSPPSPCTVQLPQACSISRSLHGGSVALLAKANKPACASAWRRALSTGVPAAETSTHLESASTLQSAAAASWLHQSELAWRLRCKGKQTCVCRLPGGKHSPLECQRRAHTLSPPSPRTEDQPQACSISRSLHGGSVARANKPACARAWRQALSAGLLSAETSTHLESATAMHLGAGASLLDQSELSWRLLCKGKQTCVCKCMVASTLHRSASGRDEHAP